MPLCGTSADPSVYCVQIHYHFEICLYGTGSDSAVPVLYCVCVCVCVRLIRRARCWLIRLHQQCGSIQMFLRADLMTQMRTRQRDYTLSASQAGLKMGSISAFIEIFKREVWNSIYRLFSCFCLQDPLVDLILDMIPVEIHSILLTGIDACSYCSSRYVQNPRM